ncbi:hypothetical protein D9M68_872300 [compost metagenome]
MAGRWQQHFEALGAQVAKMLLDGGEEGRQLLGPHLGKAGEAGIGPPRRTAEQPRFHLGEVDAGNSPAPLHPLEVVGAPDRVELEEGRRIEQRQALLGQELINREHGNP